MESATTPLGDPGRSRCAKISQRMYYLLRRRDWRSCFCDLASLTCLLLRAAYGDSLWIREHGTRRASRSIRVWRGGKMGPGRIQGLTSPQKPRFFTLPPGARAVATAIARALSSSTTDSLTNAD